MTPRHLLSHTSGIDGDVFTDTGRGDDCLERYVTLLAEVEQNHPLGATWSYCNSGYVLAGRLVEHVTGTTWDRALRERLVEPLGLGGTVTLAEEAILHRTAVGHVGEPDEEPRPTATWGPPRSAGPAGLICGAVADVLAFAQLHLAGGVAPDGTRILSAAGAEAMTGEEARLADRYSLGDSWGLGWIRFGPGWRRGRRSRSTRSPTARATCTTARARTRSWAEQVERTCPTEVGHTDRAAGQLRPRERLQGPLSLGGKEGARRPLPCGRLRCARGVLSTPRRWPGACATRAG